MKHTIAFVALLVAAAGLGAALRLPGLDRRPMHVDEAVHAAKFDILWQTGVYEYDLDEYHGPTLYYAALPAAWLSGVRNLCETDATLFRVVPAIFGVGLILLLGLMGDGLGRPAAIVAGVLTAVSPAMVYYSRYYIQETLLVFLTFLVIAAVWRAKRGATKLPWAVVAGAAVGIMHATKETCVIAWGCMLAAVVVAVLAAVVVAKLAAHRVTTPAARRTPLPSREGLGEGQDRVPESVTAVGPAPHPALSPQGRGVDDAPQGRGVDDTPPGRAVDDATRGRAVGDTPAATDVGARRPAPSVRTTAALAGVVAAIAVSVALFSRFGTNPAGPLDSIRAFATYFQRAGEGGAHEHPWHYYLHILLWWRHGAGPIWTEGFIVALAGVGIVAAITGRGTVRPNGPSAYPPPPQVATGDSLGRGGVGGGSERQVGVGFQCWPHPSPCPLPKGERDHAGASGSTLLRFLAVYTVLMLLIYSAIPYKTPWCILSALHGMILLAGVGAVTLLRAVRVRAAQVLVAVILLAATVQLGWQAHRSISSRFDASHYNPYAYAYTVRDVERLASQLDELAALHPAGRQMLIKVIVPNPWPLPWYLRCFAQVGYWETVPDDPDADVILVAHTLQPALEQCRQEAYQIALRGLRRDEVLYVYVRQPLWDAYVARLRGADAPANPSSAP